MCRDIGVDNKSINLDNMNNIHVAAQPQQMELSVGDDHGEKNIDVISLSGQSGGDVQHAGRHLLGDWEN